jgi:hypothetical protein
MFPSKEKEMALVLSKPIQDLDSYFKQWAKDPLESVIAGHRLGTEILDVIVGNDSAKSSTYGDDEVLAVLEFIIKQHKYLVEKEHSLRKRMK